MLKKLIKYDFQALSRILFPMHIGVLGVMLLSTASLAYLVRGGMEAYSVMTNVLNVTCVMLMVVTVLLIAVSSIVTLVIVGKRYYDGCLMDEGYLTFTLPVTPAEVLWGKLISGWLWMVINFAVVLFAAVFVVFFGTGMGKLFNAEFWSQLQTVFRELPSFKEVMGVGLWTFLVEILAIGIISVSAQLLQIYFAITAGGMMARKHKLLAAIGTYLGVNLVFSVISSIFSGAFSLRALSITDSAEALGMVGGYVNGMLLYSLVLSVVMAVLFFMLTDLLLTKKLNLE